MASTPTLNPVPSENYDDMRFNAGKLDEFVTSDADEYTDRLGVTHLTARGLQNSVAGALLPANNLSDVSDKDAALANLGGQSTGIAVFKAGTPASARTAIAAAASGNNSDITSISGLTTALSIIQGGTGGNTQASARSGLGLGSLSTQNSSSVTITGGSISGITDIAIADGGTGASDAPTARTNLGLGTIATQSASNVAITGGSITGITDIAIVDGGTGASTAAQARANLGAAASAGIIDASNANAGNVGEVLSVTGAAVSLVTGTAANLASLSLTAGDWEVKGVFSMSATAVNPDFFVGSINTTSATQAAFPGRKQIAPANGIAAIGVQDNTPTRRINISTTTTVYLVATTSFASGSVSATGYIEARRVR